LENGAKARENRKNYPKKTIDKTCVEGVHDNWPMSELKYCDITSDICWGPMHCLMNIGANIIENWKNTRANKPLVIQYCKTTGSHPDLYINADEKTQRRWTINAKMQDQVIIINCIT
jgi:hypothetical protein